MRTRLEKHRHGASRAGSEGNRVSGTQRKVRPFRDSPTLKFRNILVPVNFSRGSSLALRLAVPLAEAFGSSITLLHVVSLSNLGMGRGSKAANAAVERATKRLNDLAEQKIPASIQFTTAVRTGNPIQKIIQTAKLLGNDLLVLATHGHTGMKSLLIKSNAVELVYNAPCPVLVAPRKLLAKASGRFEPEKWENILVPVDFSNSSKAAVQYAAALAQAVSARLTLVHVPVVIPQPSRMGPVYSLQYESDVRNQVERKLSKWIEKDIPAGVNVEAVVRMGKPTLSGIDTEAQIRSADLIVIGPHDDSWLWRMLKGGGTTGRVVRHACTPVLSIPRKTTR